MLPVLQFFTWCESSGLGNAIRESKWLFPVIECFHLLGLSVIGGAVIIVNLRLFGLGVSTQPVAQLWREALPYLRWSLLVMIVSGLLLFTSEATKLYYHGAFWMKMGSLLLAIVFTFTVQRKVALKDEARVGPVWGKLVAIVSLILWTGVGVGGRWIGFS
ncbi:MAG TPA: DUF6644 family protein [Bryobacteraceae bacterium]|jgi:uncharacterized membrane protein SirB2